MLAPRVGFCNYASPISTLCSQRVIQMDLRWQPVDKQRGLCTMNKRTPPTTPIPPAVASHTFIVTGGLGGHAHVHRPAHAGDGGDCLDLNLAAVFVEITNPTPGAGAGRNEAIRGHVHRSPLLLWKLRENPYTHA